jgi:hypothetical protein
MEEDAFPSHYLPGGNGANDYRTLLDTQRRFSLLHAVPYLRIRTNHLSGTDAAVDGSATASSSSSWNNKNNKDRPPPPSSASSSSSAFSTATTTKASSSSSSVQQPKDEDEFDADIDMADFFAQSQNSLLNKSIVGNSLSSSNHHLGSRAHHVRKAKSTAATDDRMPGDVISTLPTTSSSSSSSGVGTSAGGGATHPHPPIVRRHHRHRWAC